MHCFNVWVIFSSAKNIEPAITTCSTEYSGCTIYSASLGSSRHPIYTFNCQFTPRPKILCFEQLSAASCFIDTYTAGTVSCFSAIGTNAIAVVDKVSAVHASRLIFFTHPLRLCHSILSLQRNLRFRQKPQKHTHTQKDVAIKLSNIRLHCTLHYPDPICLFIGLNKGGYKPTHTLPFSR